ncbi:hypothetical protein LZ32DRAFT_14799 [Colletotrichum eremochloae]|nr:hypothetical protein LZ32DRAFT_14799 [Colletotrichum eremochloae]
MSISSQHCRQGRVGKQYVRLGNRIHKAPRTTNLLCHGVDVTFVEKRRRSLCPSRSRPRPPNRTMAEKAAEKLGRGICMMAYLAPSESKEHRDHLSKMSCFKEGRDGKYGLRYYEPGFGHPSEHLAAHPLDQKLQPHGDTRRSHEDTQQSQLRNKEKPINLVTMLG